MFSRPSRMVLSAFFSHLLAFTAIFAAYWQATQPAAMTRITLIPKHRAAPELRRAYATVAQLWGVRELTAVLVSRENDCFY